MPDADAPHRDGSEYEWTAELEEGVALSTGEPWRGHRVRYRTIGKTRRWATFLLTVDGDEAPTFFMIVAAIREHERMNGRPR